MRFILPLLPGLIVLAGCSRTKPYHTSLFDDIAKLKVIDNHAHPLKLTGKGEKPDSEYDALTFEEMEPPPLAVRMRFDNPEYAGAWRRLFDYPHKDMSDEHVKEYVQAKEKASREKGDGYPVWVLDRLGIETMLANRVAMGRGLAAPRFRFVSMVDALIFPLSNEMYKRKHPDFRSFFTGEERLRARYVSESGLAAIPSTLHEWQTRVITPTLERQKKQGAIAVKFEAAYLRSLDFGEPNLSEAELAYSTYVNNSAEPTDQQYKSLQDALFRYVARECGRLELPVHIHVSLGAGGYYTTAGSNPLLLESALNDPSLRKTKFVVVHGGWPFTREAITLALKPHVYVDFSAMTFLLYPRELAKDLRLWMEMMPEKILFGSDAMPMSPQINWEEMTWLSLHSTREALAIALGQMIDDGQITRERALELARMILRDNAAKLYKI